MLLKDKGSWYNSLHNFSLRENLQLNLPRSGAWLIDLIRFFLWKTLDIILEYWKLSKLYFIIEETSGLLGLYVTVKGIISSFLVVFACLKISRGISLALNMIASTSGNANHVSRDQLTYVVNNSKLAQPFKVPLRKTPF